MPSNNIIIGLDPGGTTGYAIYYSDSKRFSLGQLEIQNHHVNLNNLLQYNRPDIVVCERFDYRPKQRAADLIPVEYIGVLRLFGQLHPKVQIVFQQQLKGKTGLWTDNKLKVLGLYKPGMPHAMDAVRQVLYFLTVTQEESYWVNRFKELA